MNTPHHTRDDQAQVRARTAESVNGNGTDTAAREHEAYRFLHALYGHCDEGYLNLWTFPGKASHWLKVTDLQQIARQAVKLSAAANIYFGIGLHSQPPASGRGEAGNVTAIPGFWLDGDIRGPAHKATDLPATVEEILSLVSECPWRPTAVVHSGHGLQLWWLFQEPWKLESEEERKQAEHLARRFQRFFQERARRVSKQIDSTADLARVLRLPGTINRKPSLEPVAVTLLHLDESLRYCPWSDFDELLPEVEEQTWQERPAGKYSNYPAPKLLPVVNGCSWLQHCRDKAKTLPEPAWYGMLSIVGRCEGGREAAHDFSRAHGDYTAAATDEKLAQALSASGPRTCANIRADLGGEPFCKECPQWGQIKSPVLLGIDRPPPLGDKDAPGVEGASGEWVPDDSDLMSGAPGVDPYLDEMTDDAEGASDLAFSTPPGDGTGAGSAAEKSKAFDQLKYARLFARAQEGLLMFVDGDQWWSYENNHWRYTGATMARADMQHFLMDQRGIKSPQITAAKVRSTLDLAGPLLGPVRVDDLNPNKEWIPLKNGVYDTRTGRFFEHDPEHRFTYCLNFNYDPKADCPQIKAFLREVMIGQDGQTCEEWVEFLEEWTGYCAIADNRAQTTLVNVGEGGNGKGAYARLLQKFVGAGQHHAIDVEMLHDPYHRAALVGKLAGFINEPSRRALEKNGGVVKAISGGDEINARNPCEKVFSFLPMTRLVVSCNDLPSTQDLSRGYFRRLILLEWRFKPQVPDTELDEKLAAELPGLFKLAMAGLQRFRERGWKFAELPESDRLKADYQKAQDTTAQFLDDVCVHEDGLTVSPAELHRAYAAWCKVKGYRALNENAFGQRLTRLGVAASKVIALPGRASDRLRPGIAIDMGALQAALGPTEWRRFTGKKDQEGVFGGTEGEG
jgi:P4 family phage/plasmid primase-like protien